MLVDQHWTWLEQIMTPLLPKQALFSVQGGVQQARDVFSASGFADLSYGVMHRYHLDGFKGYSIRLPSLLAHLLESHADIALVEKDQKMTISGTQTGVKAWGLTVSLFLTEAHFHP